MMRKNVTLDDKHTLGPGRLFLTGTLARLPMLQRGRDLAPGKDPAGHISGYRGSPLDRLRLPSAWRGDTLGGAAESPIL